MGHPSGPDRPANSGPGAPKKASDVGMLLLSVVASLACLGALIGLLSVYDGKPIFDSHLLTLNTVVAVLSTAAKAMLFYAVSHAIGQWKWISFSAGRRRLLDFERIESASRGPLGSLSLLYNTRVKEVSTVRVGALLTVLAVAMDPFAQQLLQYNQSIAFIDDPLSKTNIARAQRYSRGTTTRIQLAPITFDETKNSTSQIVPMRANADFSMQSAIMYGIVQPVFSVSQQASFSCPTGVCEYPAFSSLAVCSTCQDLTSMLSYVEANSNERLNISFDTSNSAVSVDQRPVMQYRLPNGLYLDNSAGLTMLGTTNQSRSIAHQQLDTLLWSQSLIRHRSDPNLLDISQKNPAIEASECALYYCVKRYESKVRNGTLVETSTDEKALRNAASWDLLKDPPGVVLTPSRQASLAFHPRFSYLGRTDLELGAGYNLSQDAIDSISSFVQATFAKCTSPSNCSATFDAVADNWTPINGFYMDDDRGSVQYDPSVAQALWQSANISATFEAVAASMSNALRAGADVATAATVAGTIGVSTTRYAVDWRWIVLHCVVELGGIVFVAATLMRSRMERWRVPLWGSSTLAVLSRGEVVAPVFHGAESVGEMEARARVVEAQLLHGGTMELELDELVMRQDYAPRHVDDQMRGGRFETVAIP